MCYEMEPFFLLPFFAAIVWTAYTLYKDYKKEKAKFKNGMYVPDEPTSLSERLFKKNTDKNVFSVDDECENNEIDDEVIGEDDAEENDEYENINKTQEDGGEEINEALSSDNLDNTQSNNFLDKIKKRRTY